jgi:hypothetical protein
MAQEDQVTSDQADTGSNPTDPMAGLMDKLEKQFEQLGEILRQHDERLDALEVLQAQLAAQTGEAPATPTVETEATETEVTETEATGTEATEAAAETAETAEAAPGEPTPAETPIPAVQAEAPPAVEEAPPAQAETPPEEPAKTVSGVGSWWKQHLMPQKTGAPKTKANGEEPKKS